MMVAGAGFLLILVGVIASSLAATLTGSVSDFSCKKDCCNGVDQCNSVSDLASLDSCIRVLDRRCEVDGLLKIVAKGDDVICIIDASKGGAIGFSYLPFGQYGIPTNYNFTGFTIKGQCKDPTAVTVVSVGKDDMCAANPPSGQPVNYTGSITDKEVSFQVDFEECFTQDCAGVIYMLSPYHQLQVDVTDCKFEPNDDAPTLIASQPLALSGNSTTNGASAIWHGPAVCVTILVLIATIN